MPQAVIDVIKYRKSTDGLDPTDAAVIELGRELWRDHKVKPETFAKLKAAFGPHKLVDLVLLMGKLHAGGRRRCLHRRRPHAARAGGQEAAAADPVAASHLVGARDKSGRATCCSGFPTEINRPDPRLQARSQSFRVLSPLPDSAVLPSGANATDQTGSVCPVKVRVTAPVLKFQSFTV